MNTKFWLEKQKEINQLDGLEGEATAKREMKK